jgi:short-subunit dehydrogenase
MAKGNRDFSRRYGPWALVAGASEGLGAAFARQAAARGLNLVLVARNEERLSALSRELSGRHGIEVRTLALDLANRHLLERLGERTRGLDIGLLVCNAALSLIGPFLDQPAEQHLRTLDVNCRAPLLLALDIGRAMAERGRGGIILMASMSGLQGTALVAHYAATKAYAFVLAEGLWEELAPRGVDVLAVGAGVIRTPNYLRSNPAKPRFFSAPEMEPDEVAAEALEALGSGPTVIPGRTNRLTSMLIRRVLPRKLAIRTISMTTRAMYGKRPA